MIITLILTIFLVVMAVVVLLNNPKSWTNRFYAGASVIGAWWVVANYLSLSENQTLAIFFARQITPSSVLACMMFYLMARVFPGSALGKKRVAILASIPALVITSLSWTSLNFSTSIQNGAVKYEFGLLYWPYIVVMLYYILAALVHLVRIKKRVKGAERQRISFVLYGFGLAIAPAIVIGAILPALGINVLSDYSPVFLLFFIGFTGYSILRHRLFNIRAIVARSAAYLFSVGSLAVLYGFLAFGLAQGVVLRNILTTERSQQVFNTILAVILAFTFPSIRHFFEKITDRIFYRDRYDPQILVSNIGRVLASEIQLDPLAKKIIKILEDDMRLTDANIVVLGEKNEEAEIGEKGKLDIYYQTHLHKLHQTYHIDDISTLRLPVVITDELAPSEEREMLERYHIRAALSLKTHEAFVGYLFLGDKRSGDIYNDQDIQTLRIISNELAVAIQNARSYTEIQAFNVTLKEKIEQATKDLTHANSELKALDKAKDEFISMASHQLRTPLTAVRGYTSMVMDGDFGKITADQKESLRQSFDAATRMSRLVDDLLNVSRIQSGKFKIERTSFDLNKALPEEMSLLNTTASTKNVTVTYHAPKTPVPLIAVDEGKTRQCIMNLADNAIYYSSTVKEGGKVDVYLESDGKDIIYRVVDNGIGVPKDQQAKLFKKFYRAPNAQKTRPDGTGLGLFLVGKVIGEQGGEIIFESEEGKGSTFGWKLPLSGENDASKAPAAVSTGEPGRETEPAEPAKAEEHVEAKKPTS